jgi:Xaa-Pro aminopeptidase
MSARPGSAWSQKALRAQSLARRRETLVQALRQEGLDALIAYGSGRHSFLASNPAWYATGFRQIGPHMALLLPREGEPAAVITPARDRTRFREQSEIADVTAVEPEAFLSALKGAIEKRGLRGKRIGVAGGVQPRAVSDAWPDLLGAAPLSAEKLVSDIAKVRDEWALACVREGAEIAEKGWQRALEVARPGMAEFELAGEIETYMRELGADDNFQLLSASQHNRAAHRPSDRALAAGDILLGEITPAVAGEFVQICRTAVLGTPTARQRDTFALLDGALRGAMRAARPGVGAREIVEVMNAPIAAAGYGTYTKPPYMRTRGHSMALGSMDPEIALDSDQLLVKGMVFVMHPNQYIPETGYMMCGEPVLIADDGAHPLTSKMGRLESIPL